MRAHNNLRPNMCHSISTALNSLFYYVFPKVNSMHELVTIIQAGYALKKKNISFPYQQNDWAAFNGADLPDGWRYIGQPDQVELTAEDAGEVTAATSTANSTDLASSDARAENTDILTAVNSADLVVANQSSDDTSFWSSYAKSAGYYANLLGAGANKAWSSAVTTFWNQYDINVFPVVNDSQRKIYFVIPGTDNIDDFIKDGTLVLRGNSSFGLTGNIIKQLNRVLNDPDYANYKVVLLGHSLGGSLVNSVMLELQAKGTLNDITAITFESPGVDKASLSDELKAAFDALQNSIVNHVSTPSYVSHLYENPGKIIMHAHPVITRIILARMAIDQSSHEDFTVLHKMSIFGELDATVLQEVFSHFADDDASLAILNAAIASLGSKTSAATQQIEITTEDWASYSRCYRDKVSALLVESKQSLDDVLESLNEVKEGINSRQVVYASFAATKMYYQIHNKINYTQEAMSTSLVDAGKQTIQLLLTADGEFRADVLNSVECDGNTAMDDGNSPSKH